MHWCFDKEAHENYNVTDPMLHAGEGFGSKQAYPSVLNVLFIRETLSRHGTVQLSVVTELLTFAFQNIGLHVNNSKSLNC